MLNKNLLKVAVVLILGVNVTACGQSETPNSPAKSMTVEKVAGKKIISSKWEEFQQGFNDKKTVGETVYNARVTMAGGNARKATMADRIDIKKWKEFQKSFTERAEYYVANISKSFN